MDEEKKTAALDESALETVAGGMGGDGFEQAWAAYANAHCGKCGVLRCGVKDIRDRICGAGKQMAAAEWEAGQPVKCRSYSDLC